MLLQMHKITFAAFCKQFNYYEFMLEAKTEMSNRCPRAHCCPYGIQL